MNRRSTTQKGFVRFPTGSDEYKNSGEGGMFVQLVVEDPADRVEEEWAVCCGLPNIHVMLSENLVGGGEEDYHFPEAEDPFAPVEGLEHGPELHAIWASRCASIQYLAAVTLGSTGWSGWNKDLGKHWECSYENLTEDGKNLYDLMGKLYPHCKIHLLTWLDT